MLTSCQIKISVLDWKPAVNKTFSPLNHREWQRQCHKVRYHSKQRSILKETQSILVEAPRCSSCSHSCVCNSAAVCVRGKENLRRKPTAALLLLLLSRFHRGSFSSDMARDVGVWCVGSQIIQIQQTPPRRSIRKNWRALVRRRRYSRWGLLEMEIDEPRAANIYWRICRGRL
jgi:hypothetical protein